MLKVRIIRYKNIVIADVLEMDDSLRENMHGTGKTIFTSSDGFKLCSYGSQKIYDNEFYLRGYLFGEDWKPALYKFIYEEGAIEYCNQLKNAVREFNQQNAEKSDDVGCIENFIAE